MYQKLIKRLLDILASAGLLIVLSPVLLVTGVLVRNKLGSPVLFRQKRPGKNEEIFELMKFRSMSDARNERGELLPDKERLTRFGRFLRSSSLDELPELWCILKGDMSFVGPRPLSVMYLPYYSPAEARRHDVSPGLTGLAQVSGRNTLDWDSRLALDVEYVENLSFALDASIVWKTFRKVIMKDDVVVAGTGRVGDLDEIRSVRRPEYLKKG